MQKIRDIFCKAFAVFFSFLFLALIFVDKRIKYFSPLNCSVPNIVLVLIGVVPILVLLIFGSRIKRFINKFTARECKMLLVIAGIVLYIIQLYIIYNTYYQAGWDCGMIAEMSEKLARGELMIRDSGYYSSYLSQNPHQAFIVFILTVIKKVSNHFGTQDMYYFSVMVGALSVNMTCILLTLAVKNMKGRYPAALTFIIAVVFLAFSPQSTVPYTDVYAMVFNAAILYLYTCKEKKLKWILIAIVAFIGYHIKATVMICFIAIGICEFLKCNRTNFLKRFFIAVFLVFVSGFVSGLIVQYGINYIGFEPDKDAAFTPTHYAMMGLNDVTTGVWYEEDVNYSASFDNISDRQRGNVKIIGERLREKGLLGLLAFEFRKLLMNYNDGSFYFWKEGGAVLWKSDPPNHTASKLLRFYYFRQHNKIMNHVLQTQWLMVLMLASIAAWSFIKVNCDGEFILAVTIIGITMFTLMFEGRSRYLILYTPYYLVLAVIGLINVEGKIIQKLDMD
jgi:hypothetical protein